MDDISALLGALQATQARKSAARLSERNVVELVLKLKQLGLLGDELLHTINGKEYITTHRLRADVEAALRAAGGRLELAELPALVGVDLVHCEKQAALIIAESGGDVIEAQGELITVQYFDTLAAEINELLQEAGVLSVAELAVNYALSAELLRSLVEARVGGAIHGRMDGSLIYTPAFVRNIKAQLRGALRGAEAPVTLATLARGLGLDAAASGGAMLPGLTEELVADGAARGSARGGAWVPEIHTVAQAASVAGFWRQNGWVAYDLVRRSGIAGERAYLKTTFPDGIALDTVYASPSLVAQVEGAVEEALRNGSWLDAAALLPPALSDADVAMLLERAAGGMLKDGRGQVLASTCVVSAAVIAAAKEAAETAGKQQADRGAALRRGADAAASGGAAGGVAATATAVQGSSNNSGRGGSNKKGASAAASKVDAADSDDDWSMGAGGKKGKKGKGGGGGGGKAAKGAAAAGGGGGGVKTGGGKQAASKDGCDADSAAAAGGPGSALSVASLTAMVLELLPDMEGAGSGGCLPEVLAELLRPAALAAHAAAAASVFTSGAEARRRAKEGAQRALEESYALLQLYARGLELLQDDEGTLAVMQRHLLRSTGGDALDALLSWCKWEWEVAASGDSTGAAGGAGSGASGAELACTAPPGGLAVFKSASERAALVRELPQELSVPLRAALDGINGGGGGDVEALLVQLEAAAAECGMRLRRLEKKGEKALLTAQRARLLGALESETSPAAALALALPLLAAKAAGRLVNAPGRAISGVLAALRPSMSEADADLVQRFHAAVVDSLRAHAGRGDEAGGGGNSSDSGDPVASQQQQLDDLLPQLKAAVMGGSQLPPAAASGAP